MNREEHLLDLIDLHKPSSLTEIGIAQGYGAVRMIKRAAQYQSRITYYGFDLFAEGLTDEIRQREFQVGQKTMALAEAQAKFAALAGELWTDGVELSVRLYPGPTSQTLLDSSAAQALAADLVYLDGGHSVDTIRLDYQALLNGGAKVICLDDFIHHRDPAFLARYGCNAIVQELTPNNVAFLPVIDGKIWPTDGKPFGAGQVVYPRSAWPWSRMQAALHVIRNTKPKTVFVYADDLQVKYLAHEVAQYGGILTTDHTVPADFAYVDCARRLDDGTHLYMTKEEAQSAWEQCPAPVRVFGGLRLDRSEGGAGHVIDPGNSMIVNGLDLLDGVEVGAFCWPKGAWPIIKGQIHVATRNCVADEVICKNVSDNVPRINRWIAHCQHHDGRIVLVSAGPSLRSASTIAEIKNEAARPGTKVLCVKHAHDYIIENGIVPWGCILLDPRDHVKQFIQNPHPDTIYFVATMVSHTTLDILLEKGARVVGYNAIVGAGEDKLFPPNTLRISGGTSAAMRSLPVMMALGFRKFCLFAMDSCFDKRPENVNEKTPLGYNRYQKIEVAGRKFWTELELLAQAQDFKQFIEDLRQHELLSSLEMDMRGDGIIQHLWAVSRTIKPAFSEVERSWGWIR